MQLYQERDFGAKINATFQYVGENFRSLGRALLYIVGPVALVAGIATSVIQADILRLIGESAYARTNNPIYAFQMLTFFTSPTFWLTAALGLLTNVLTILTTYAHLKVYERYNGNGPAGGIRVADVWAEVQPVLGRGVLISVLASIVTVMAAFVFVFPAIYVGVVLSLALAVTSFEGTNFGETWNRCFQLIRDKWWSTFGLIFVMSFIIGFLGLVFAVPTALVSVFISLKLLPGAAEPWLIVGNVVSLVGKTLLNALLYLALGFQYGNLVERQEGRGTAALIDSIGTDDPARP